MCADAAASGGSRARIALLPEHVRNQIAAGEVIERPASVVKELVENALDAGARRIEIDLEEGGTRLVRVRDDGSGMPREDVELAFVPHATSKLHAASDLEHIASLGFRGEALASMGAVARCRITTREPDRPIGWSIENDGGVISAARECGTPAGTCVEVRDLFFNMPARRRFLKRASTELARCLDVIQRIALAHAGVAFVATHDEKRVFDVEAAMDLRARIRRTFGAELASELVAVNAVDSDLELTGFVAPPRLARSDASRQMWFLNGRPLRDKVLARALKEGYRGFLLDGRQPVVFLALSMDPARADVNVHPAKAEVRFRDERRLFGFVVSTLREALRASDLSTPATRMIERARSRDDLDRSLDAGTLSRAWSGTFESRSATEPMAVFEAPLPPLPRELGATRTIAEGARGTESVAIAAGPGRPFQIARTFIVRELPAAVGGGFEIIDQHALHERVTFEALISEMRAGRLETQRSLVPEIVECSRAEVALVSEHAASLARIGIDVAPFGDTALAVHGLPARLSRPNPAAIVREVIAVLESAAELRAETVLEDVLHRAACRSSVMAGDALDTAEMEALIERGARLVSDQTCVHGRPTRVRFTLADLERAFERR